MDLGLRGRRAVVTGASRGIGRCIAETLAAEGASLAICARGAPGIDAAKKQLERAGVKVFAKSVDVANGDSLRAFIGEAAETLGGLDILVSNVTASAGQGEPAWRANFEVDLMGTVRACEAALPHLVKSGAGSIVVIGTTAALETFGAPGGYGALKAALVNYASGLAHALARQSVRVNVVSPGPVYFEGGAWAMIQKAMPAFYETTLKACPQGRMGTPEEVARAVAFLASPAASLITGANLVTDGAFTKRVNF
ncbi:MAG TPA: SDR family oxidoreductase [Myxococcota bacterium]|nr:SDR family oxidoreductase [Myxococcota bacterium]